MTKPYKRAARGANRINKVLSKTRSFIRYLTVSGLGMLILCAFVSEARGQPTNNVFLRLLMIRTGTNIGTSFTIEVDSRQYLITAKHVVAGLKADDIIHVLRGEQWLTVNVKVFRCDDPIDIAVLVAPQQMTPTFPMEPIGKIRMGQDVFFVGFPYGLFTGIQNLFAAIQNVNDLYPLAFFKKAILSGIGKESGHFTLYLDGHNNPGFSGGPIIFRDLDQSSEVYRVVGVVSGFRHEFTPVLEPEEIKREEIKPEDIAQARIMEQNGRVFRLKDTGKFVQANTGIIVGSAIMHAVDLIRKNPIGPKVSEQTK